MARSSVKRDCCCGQTEIRKCCKRQYKLVEEGLGRLDGRFVKLVELQIAKQNFTNKSHFPLMFRFELEGHRLMFINCSWVSATRFKVVDIAYRSFNSKGEYQTLMKLSINDEGGLKLITCHKNRFENAAKAFNYLRSKIRRDMDAFEQLNPMTTLGELLDTAEQCGLEKKRPPSKQKAA